MLLDTALPTKVPQHIFLLLAGPIVNFEMKYTKIYQNKDHQMFRNLIKLTMENIYTFFKFSLLNKNFTTF
jgi:hypothetical protein